MNSDRMARMTIRESEGINALLAVMHRLERRWTLPIPNHPDRHDWQALPFWDFLMGVDAAEPHVRERSFLDVGCGIGTKLALMHHLGWRVAGIEAHQPYAEAATELLEGVPLDVIVGDARDITVFEAGLVYAYRPLRNDAACDRLEEHIVAHVQPGTVVYFAQSRFRPEWGEPVTTEIGVVS